jgi:hypothetical protein
MRLSVLILALALAGCGNSKPQPGPDMTLATGDMTVVSLCGHPGDPGNDNGVGKYCMMSSECTGKAFICSTVMPIPQGPTSFCTMACDPYAPNPNASCGANASCTCLMPGACGCVPDSCRVGLFG